MSDWSRPMEPHVTAERSPPCPPPSRRWWGSPAPPPWSPHRCSRPQPRRHLPPRHRSRPRQRASTAATPSVSPTPQTITSAGAPVPVTSRVRLVVDDQTDPAAEAAVRTVLAAHGVTRVDRVAPADASGPPGLLVVRLGSATRADIVTALGSTAVPSSAEAYGLRSGTSGATKSVTIGGTDGAGQFYGVQTLRQLLTGSRSRRSRSATARRCRCAAPSKASTGSRGPPQSASTRWTSTGR